MQQWWVTLTNNSLWVPTSNRTLFLLFISGLFTPRDILASNVHTLCKTAYQKKNTHTCGSQRTPPLMMLSSGSLFSMQVDTTEFMPKTSVRLMNLVAFSLFYGCLKPFWFSNFGEYPRKIQTFNIESPVQCTVYIVQPFTDGDCVTMPFTKIECFRFYRLNESKQTR